MHLHLHMNTPHISICGQSNQKKKKKGLGKFICESSWSRWNWKLGDVMAICRLCSGYSWLWLVLFEAKWRRMFCCLLLMAVTENWMPSHCCESLNCHESLQLGSNRSQPPKFDSRSADFFSTGESPAYSDSYEISSFIVWFHECAVIKIRTGPETMIDFTGIVFPLKMNG